jgi:hypothetical protein
MVLKKFQDEDFCFIERCTLRFGRLGCFKGHDVCIFSLEEEEGTRCSGALIFIHQNTWNHIPEDNNPRNYRHVNLMSHEHC